MILCLKIPKCFFFSSKKTFHAVQTHYVTQLLIRHYKSFGQLLLNQSHHCNIPGNTALFQIMFIDPFLLVVIRTFVRCSKLPLLPVWKELKNFAFSWKLVTNLLLINNGGMIGTFFTIEKKIIIHQFYFSWDFVIRLLMPLRRCSTFRRPLMCIFDVSYIGGKIYSLTLFYF